MRTSWPELRRQTIGALVALCVAGCDAQGQPTGATVAIIVPASQEEIPDAKSPIRLGVQTHFSQGWSQSSLDLASQSGATLLRDSLSWETVEATPGNYDFSSPNAGKLDSACRQGFSLLLAATPKHSSYDAGALVHTPRGQSAYGNYVKALAEHFGPCLVAVEIGNEINSAGALAVPRPVDPYANYVAIVREAKRALTGHAEVTVLGGSTHMIATGFLSRLFRAGLLEWADAIAVHPYRRHADGTAAEILHLREVMQAYGREVPIWATEFSPNNSDQAQNAGEMAKIVTLLGATGVRNVVWYALIDQRWFPNMGLFTGRKIKPTGRAFAFIQRELLARGAPEPMITADGLFAFRFGADAMIVWGRRQNVLLPKGAVVFDVSGRATGEAGTLLVSEIPRIVLGAHALTPLAAIDLADTMQDYGASGWSYLMQTSAGAFSPLGWHDGQFDSALASRWHQPLYIRQFTAATAGDGQNPTRVVWRYTSRSTSSIKATLSLCASKSARGDGVDIGVYQGEVLVRKDVLVDGKLEYEIPLSLAEDTRVDIRAGPNQTRGGDTFALRAIISQGPPVGARICP